MAVSAQRRFTELLADGRVAMAFFKSWNPVCWFGQCERTSAAVVVGLFPTTALLCAVCVQHAAAEVGRLERAEFERSADGDRTTFTNVPLVAKTLHDARDGDAPAQLPPPWHHAFPLDWHARALEVCLYPRRSACDAGCDEPADQVMFLRLVKGGAYLEHLCTGHMRVRWSAIHDLESFAALKPHLGSHALHNLQVNVDDYLELRSDLAGLVSGLREVDA